MRIMIADRDPPPIGADAHSVRNVEPFANQDLIASCVITGAGIQDVPCQNIAGIAADENLAVISIKVRHRDRARVFQEARPPGRPKADGLQFAGWRVDPARRQLEYRNAAPPVWGGAVFKNNRTENMW